MVGYFSILSIDNFIKRCIYINHQPTREFLAEMFGTTLLVIFGCASIAEYKLLKVKDNENPILLTVNLSFGFALTLATLVTFKTSGIIKMVIKRIKK